MTNLNIDSKIHKQWIQFYETFSKLKYPTLKNFTEQKLVEMMQNDKNMRMVSKPN